MNATGFDLAWVAALVIQGLAVIGMGLGYATWRNYYEATIAAWGILFLKCSLVEHNWVASGISAAFVGFFAWRWITDDDDDDGPRRKRRRLREQVSKRVRAKLRLRQTVPQGA